MPAFQPPVGKPVKVKSILELIDGRFTSALDILTPQRDRIRDVRRRRVVVDVALRESARDLVRFKATYVVTSDLI